MVYVQVCQQCQRSSVLLLVFHTLSEEFMRKEEKTLTSYQMTDDSYLWFRATLPTATQQSLCEILEMIHCGYDV